MEEEKVYLFSLKAQIKRHLVKHLAQSVLMEINTRVHMQRRLCASWEQQLNTVQTKLCLSERNNTSGEDLTLTET